MYDKFKNIQNPVPVVTDLDTSLNRRRTKNEGKSASIFFSSLAILGIIYFLQLKVIKSLIPIPTIYIFLIYFGLSLSLSAKLAVMFSVDLADKVKQKTINQGGNSKFSLNKVWRIALGGITESIPINTKSFKGNTVHIKYDADAIVLKFLMNSVIDCEPDGDIKHYMSLAGIYDIIMKNNYDFEIISLRYNIENDEYWETVSNKIAKASNLGNSYTWLRTKIEDCLYTHMDMYSTIDVQYLIVKTTPTSSLTPTVMANTILANIKQARIEIAGISMNEFKMLLEQYFSIDIAIEDIEEYTTNSNLPYETKLLGYTINGDYHEEEKVYTYIIPSEFRTFEDEMSLLNKAKKRKPKQDTNTIITEEEYKDLHDNKEDLFGGW